MEFDGKTVIVTGGGRGIGRAVCAGFAKEGANIVINYSGNESAALETKRICESFGAKAEIIKADVSDYVASAGIVEYAIKTFGSADILVNNAGITADGLIMRMSEQDFDKVIAVNLKGTFNCIKHVTRNMSRQHYGRIINISSVVGISGNAGQINYSASKAGIIGITKSAAKELASRNVTVNAIAPGFIETDMTDALKDEIKSGMLADIPLGRFGQAEDIANAAVFLASEKAAYITGQVISVNGGMYI